MKSTKALSHRSTRIVALAVAALALCALLTGCDALIGQLQSTTPSTTDEKLLVQDRESDEPSPEYCYDTIKTTGLAAAKAVFSLAATSCEEEIEISRDLEITEDDMRSAISELRFTPEYLCSTGSFSFTVSSPDDIEAYYVTALKLSYDYDTSLIPSYRATLASAVSSITDSVVTSDMSAADKALALHDYLVSHCEYDESYQSYSTYDVIVNGYGTCQGYAQAYRMLLERVGVPCDYASSEEMNHSWNMVNIDGLWYHVDVTWDDPIVLEGQLDGILHTFFLKSDATMAANEHYSWVADHEAPADYEG